MSYDEIITSLRTDYNGELSIVKAEEGRFLVLAQGTDQIGAINIADPDRIYGYVELNCLLALATKSRNIFIIGHGIGTMGRKFQQEKIDAKIVEIDPEMVELSRKYFGYIGDNVVIGDGFEVLKEEPDHSIDCIILDAFINARVPRQFVSTDFFKLVTQKLTPGGYFAMNHIGYMPDTDNYTEEIMETLKASFPFVRRYTNIRDKNKRGNFLFFAGEKEFTEDISTRMFFQG